MKAVPFWNTISQHLDEEAPERLELRQIPQELGLIGYSRGHIRIVDRAGLERVACECYQVSRRELQTFERYADERTGYVGSRR
ncbi:MAG TPA: hypothetical protein VME18_12380 [Acidobacteriaceae bacterium]|nr:hypothetical protein [Acidobacteriaceae bacterium]